MFAAGVWTVGPSIENYLLMRIPLPAGFGDNPVVIATAQQQAGTTIGEYTDTFAVTVVGTEPLEFAVNIFRVDNIFVSGAGWGQNLQIAWIASDPGS